MSSEIKYYVNNTNRNITLNKFHQAPAESVIKTFSNEETGVIIIFGTSLTWNRKYEFTSSSFQIKITQTDDITGNDIGSWDASTHKYTIDLSAPSYSTLYIHNMNNNAFNRAPSHRKKIKSKRKNVL